jgi:membrane AbrB-like protein
MLTIVVPIGAAFLPVMPAPPGPPQPLLDAGHILALFVVCWAVGLIFVRLKIPAGMVLGAMAAGTTIRLAGLIPGDLPDLMVVGILILTGSLIGSRFVGLTRSEVVGAAKGGLVTTAITVAIAVLVAGGVASLTGMPYGQVWLGLAPGGLESMGALGVALGYDTAFIAAHHVIRLLLLSFVIPAVVILVRRVEARAAVQPPGPPSISGPGSG